MTRKTGFRPWDVTDAVTMARTARARWLSRHLKSAAKAFSKSSDGKPNPLILRGLHIS